MLCAERCLCVIDEELKSIEDFYNKEFSSSMTAEEISAKLDMFSSHPNIRMLRRKFCDELVFALTEGFVKYDDALLAADDGSLIKLLYENIEKLDKDSYFFWAFYYYLKKQYKKCKDNIHKVCSEQLKQGVLNEDGLLDFFLVPFKNAPDEILDFITDEVKSVKSEDGIPELCDLMSLYYRSNNNDVVVDALLSFIQKYPNYKSPNEILGYTYYNMSMWNNAIACFEKVEQEYYFFMSDIYWMLAWSSGKIKNYVDEEKYYRLSYELAPEMQFTLNNLGYSLYKQKKYLEAKEIFKQCLEAKKDLPCAANNYVRVLIALGRNVDAKKFVNSGEFKVAKAIRDRVKKLDNHNARLKKYDIAVEPDIDDNESTEKVTIDIGVKRQQFSNEKLLEDELTARIENGIPVFGIKLKVYKRKGEYGRQYIIPIGRLDLLCEDAAGNLYIVELKKDSGYDDAYEQTAQYLDWFEKSEKFKSKKVYGIICLNNPTQELISKVHNDKRMRLFEYRISYTEL